MSESNEVSLADLGVESDPGTEWHPRPNKANAFLDSGLLPDLNEREVEEHLAKPETYPDTGKSLGAEDSQESPEGEI